jgi:hypothetical protein
MPCNPLQLRQLKPKIRGNLNQCPKMVPQNHTTKVLILQVELCSRTMTEKAYFCGRMALWHQITRILSKPHPHPKGHDSLPVVFLIFYRAGKIVPYVPLYKPTIGSDNPSYENLALLVLRVRALIALF